MLTQLSIRDIVLIEALTIRFEAGLAVLTGETGAGKSILLDALALALGARGDAGLVRQGAPQGQVSAVFELPTGHELHDALEEAGVAVDPGEPVIVRRVQSIDGRSRAFVNDQPVGVALLRLLGHRLVEIHGQHDDRALVDPASHRDLLDAFGGLFSDVAHVGALHSAWRDAEATLVNHRTRLAEAAREADFLRASVDELSALSPEIGEEETLAETRSALMRSEKIAGDLNAAHETLAGPSSPVPEIASLLRRLERKAGEVPGTLEEVNAHLGQALDQLAEAEHLIAQAIADTDHDPHALERIEERLFALRALARKHDVAVDDLADVAVQMADRLTALDAGETRLAELETAAVAARDAYDRAAAGLSAARGQAAEALTKAVMAELPALKLDKAYFMVERSTEPDARAGSGIDTIAFWVRTNPGTRAGPIMKVASGGELSRFLLALKVALADRGSAPTLIFDEIDTGVGGSVADAIGVRLARLSRKVQVLAVTHAPQVAARAAHHFLIAKTGKNGGEAVATDVTEIDLDARREEIARMLAGASITEEARAAAGRLLEAAAG